MEVSHRRIDLTPFYDRGSDPFDLIDRGKAETWYVGLPIVQGEQMRWAVCNKAEKVHVPLVPYLVQPYAEQALAFGFQLALSSVYELRRPVRRIHLSVGAPGQMVEERGERYWRLHLGVAVML